MAHFLWPPVWLGAPPPWTRPWPPSEVDSAPATAVNLEDLSDVVADSELPDGLRVLGHRDGMIELDFTSLGDEPAGTPEGDLSEHRLRCLRTLNAHLACLHASTKQYVALKILTSENVIRRGGNTSVVSRWTATNHEELYRARRDATDLSDWRLSRGATIGQAEVRRSFDLLRGLLTRPRRDVVLLRVELLLRSVVALEDDDYSGALIAAWTAAEGLLRDRFLGYLSDRDQAGNSSDPFISRRRREFLESSEMTSRVMAEILSLADWLPFGLYKRVVTGGKARNNWLHAQKAVTRVSAVDAIQAAQELFELVEEIAIPMPLNRRLTLA